MNRNIRNLIVAAPLAVAALMVAPGVAMASEPGPVIVMPSGHGDPKPMDIADPTPVPDPKPAPQGPGEVSNGKPKPTHPKPDHPQGPKDKAPVPQPQGPQGPGDIASPEPEPTHPDGPGDLTNPAPCPTHGVDCTDGGDEPTDEGDQGCFEGCDLPEENTVASPEKSDDVVRPTRIDAGFSAAEHNDGGLDLTWLIAGGTLVSASGAAFAARRRTQSKA